MVKNYASLITNTLFEFNKKSPKNIFLGIDFKAVKASWSLTVLLVLSLTIPQKTTASNKSNFVFATPYTYHTVILKPSVAYGHSGGGGHGYALFSPTDHDKPIYHEGFTTNKTIHPIIQTNITLTATNTNTKQS